ncbi:hypothetical protein niasHS_015933 [Heterodera schachtii]|uniref:Uncharacterized protein n=1 Tax=Heterodera schachtii TaxID=97005 RepID=A0ABD2HQW7_HETSC
MQYNRIERCRMQAEKLRRQLEQNGTTQFDNSGNETEIASGSMDTAHLEDTFLMSGVLGHERESDPLSRTQPVEEGKGEREKEERKLNSTYPLTTPHNKEQKEPNRTQTIEDGSTLLNLEDPFLMSGVLSHERESDPLSRTQPVEEGKGEREKEERKLNSTYPLTTPHNKEHTEPDRTQTIEDGPTLLDLTHPVAIGGTAGSGDEPPKQQQHKQSQEHTDEEQRDFDVLAGVVPFPTDDSSLLLLDPTLATSYPLINIFEL